MIASVLARSASRYAPSEEIWTVEPRQRGPIATAREIWKHRRFVTYLGAKALRKLYARTALGQAWVVITPVLPLVLRAIVFGGLIGVTSEGIPYFLFLTVGTVLWNLFSSALMWGTRGLEMNRGVLDRVYIPKVLLPIATTTPALVNFAISVATLIVVLVYYFFKDGRLYLVLGPQLLLAVPATVLTLLFALSIGLFTAVWGETARDARFVMAQVLTIWLLLTPILYPLSAVPAEWRWLVPFNPMAVLIEMFKLSVLGIGELNLRDLAIACGIIGVVLTGGFAFFSRAEAEAPQIT